METFWFLWLRFRRAYDATYDSDFLFSPGHKRSYDSAYDSVASENQPSLDTRIPFKLWQSKPFTNSFPFFSRFIAKKRLQNTRFIL